MPLLYLSNLKRKIEIAYHFVDLFIGACYVDHSEIGPNEGKILEIIVLNGKIKFNSANAATHSNECIIK